MPDSAANAWQRCQVHLDKLFAALDQLDEAGGITTASTEGGWKSGAMDRAAGALLAAREACDAQLARIESTRRRRGRAG